MSDLVASETLQPVLDLIDADLDNAIKRLQAFLQIPSISTDTEYASDVRRCAEHVTNDLASIGLQATMHDTQGHPMVVATDDSAGPDAPRVLYYGHYDVQPVQPLDEWNYPPFDGVVIQSNYLDLAMLMDYWSPLRLNHHTESTPMLYGARECARVVLQEGLEAGFRRHRLASRALRAGITAMGLELFGDPAPRMEIGRAHV